MLSKIRIKTFCSSCCRVLCCWMLKYFSSTFINYRDRYLWDTDVENDLDYPEPNLGKRPRQAAQMKYEPWQVCLFYVPEENSSPVKAKMTLGWCVSRVCCLSVPCLGISKMNNPCHHSHRKLTIAVWQRLTLLLSPPITSSSPSPSSRCVLWQYCGCNCLQDWLKLWTRDLSAVIC